MSEQELRTEEPGRGSQDAALPSDPPQPSPTVNWEQGAARSIEVPGAPGFVFAPILTRIAAYLIDGVGVVLVSLVPLIVLETALPGESDLKLIATAIAVVAVTWAYFVLSWRSSARATPGQRILKIQVGNAFDGRTLTLEQATSRWFALAFPFNALTVIPVLANAASGLLILWDLVLLIGTAMSATRQGPHDRFARSAVVQRAGEGMSGVAIGCILVVGLLVLLGLATIVLLIFLGAQLEELLREVGDSI